MCREYPFFSIITVAFNAQDTIRDTLQSTLSQSFSDFEIVVQDGMSKDDTLNRIPEDGRIRVFSEKDSGIYDGMNRAIGNSRGKYLIFMNCGDSFASDTVLEQLHSLILQEQEPGVVYGDYELDQVRCVQAAEITRFYLFRNPICHQSMVIHRQVFETIGMYDCRFKMMADYDLTVHSWMSGVRFVHGDVVVCRYLGGGVSESKKGLQIIEKERKEIIGRYYPAGEQLRYGLILALTMRKLRSKLLGNGCPRFIRSAYRMVVNRINGKSV